MERRIALGGGLRAERRAEGATPTLTGHAAVFNQPTTIAGLFVERVAPGAFLESIARDDCRGLFNHEAELVLGRQSAGTLELSEDAIGLAFVLLLPDTSIARDLAVSVARGDVRECSFTFEVEGDSWEWPRDPAELPIRTLEKCRLYDVGPVTFPAYPQTDVQANAARVLAEARAALPAGAAGAAAVLEAARAAEGEGRAATATRARRLRLAESVR